MTTGKTGSAKTGFIRDAFDILDILFHKQADEFFPHRRAGADAVVGPDVPQPAAAQWPAWMTQQVQQAQQQQAQQTPAPAPEQPPVPKQPSAPFATWQQPNPGEQVQQPAASTAAYPQGPLGPSAAQLQPQRRPQQHYEPKYPVRYHDEGGPPVGNVASPETPQGTPRPWWARLPPTPIQPGRPQPPRPAPPANAQPQPGGAAPPLLTCTC